MNTLPDAFGHTVYEGNTVAVAWRETGEQMRIFPGVVLRVNPKTFRVYSDQFPFRKDILFKPNQVVKHWLYHTELYHKVYKQSDSPLTWPEPVDKPA